MGNDKATKVGVNLFGRTSVVMRNGVRVDKLGGAKSRQVLGILAVQPGVAVGKDRLAELLWAGAPPRSYMGTLESYVCLLRRAIGEAGRTSAIRTTNTGYVLDRDEAVVDLGEVRQLIGRARAADPGQAVGLVEGALGLATGDLLGSEQDADWALDHRVCINRELVTACVDAAAVAYRAAHLGAVIRLSRAAVDRDALAEPAWRLLMMALAAQDRHGEALRAYAELRERLSDELGIEPSPACREVYLRVLHSRPAPTGGDRSEVRTLMHLLRQALEGVPGVVVPDSDAWLSRVAVGVLARSA